MKTITGIVQKGKQRGKRLGYPTINIPCSDESVSGVYAARVFLDSEAPYMAAAFAEPGGKILEAHILDFKDTLYGEAVSIRLHKKLRESKDFNSDEELKQAIAEDLKAVREYFR